MRILFFPLITRGAAVGTITRCLAVADELRKLGHESFFLTNGEGAKLVKNGGFPFEEGVIPEPPGPPHLLYDLSDVAVFLNLAREDYLRAALQAEQHTIDRFRPDVLFSEFKLTAPITAARTGLPLVSSACSPADPRFVSPLYQGRRSLDHQHAVEGFNRILDELRMEPVSDVAELFFMRSTLKVAPTLPDMEPLLASVPDLHYVGYLLYDRWEDGPLPSGVLDGIEAPNIVFVYFSTGEVGPGQYARVVPQAYGRTEFHAIVAVGDHPELPDMPEPTSNTTWVRFVPGGSILSLSKALVFHGGQNTAMASLIHGVPGLVIPGGDFERDFNARGIARIGAGIHLTVEEFTPSRLLEATRELVAGAYGNASERNGKRVLELGGPRRAAELALEAGG